MAEMMRGADATTRGDRHWCSVPDGSVGTREVNFSPVGGWYREWL